MTKDIIGMKLIAFIPSLIIVISNNYTLILRYSLRVYIYSEIAVLALQRFPKNNGVFWQKENYSLGNEYWIEILKNCRDSR